MKIKLLTFIIMLLIPWGSGFLFKNRYVLDSGACSVDFSMTMNLPDGGEEFSQGVYKFNNKLSGHGSGSYSGVIYQRNGDNTVINKKNGVLAFDYSFNLDSSGAVVKISRFSKELGNTLSDDEIAKFISPTFMNADTHRTRLFVIGDNRIATGITVNPRMVCN